MQKTTSVYKPLQALLIEDNPSDARLIQESLLTLDNFYIDIHDAGTISEAAKYLKNNNPNIILLDLSLPDSSGLNGITKLLKITSTIPIIVLTGQVNTTLEKDIIKLGAQDYLIKGYTSGDQIKRSIIHSIERKKLTEELKAYSHTIAHDLKSPLNSIKTLSQLLLSKKEGDIISNKDLSYLEVIARNTSNLASLITNILNYAKSGGEVKDTVEISAEELFEEIKQDTELILEEVKGQINIKNISNIYLKGDKDLIRQSFLNLIRNSIKYRSNKRPIIIKIEALKTDNGQIQINFEDNGIGIKKEKIDLIFNEFSRVHDIKNNSPEGSGIGLATVKRYIESNKGQVKVRSTPDEMTRFIITLPSID